MGLKEIKKEIEGLEKKNTAISADIERMKNKQASVDGLITSLEASLTSARDAYQETVRSFARDEIGEVELKKALKTVTELESQLSTQQAVIKVVMDDILPREEECKEINKQLRSRRDAAWRLIADAEVAKLAVPLMRAFAACRKTDLPSDHRGFCYHIAEKHLFVGGGAFDQAAEELEREYL